MSASESTSASADAVASMQLQQQQQQQQEQPVDAAAVAADAAALAEENAALKQHILQLSTDLRALSARPGGALAYIAEIEALSGAIQSLRSETDQFTIAQARKRVCDTAALAQADDEASADLPPASRLRHLEDSMLTATERAALKGQRERLKASIDSNFGAGRVDALVEAEVDARRRVQRAQAEADARHLEVQMPQGGGFSSLPAASQHYATTPVRGVAPFSGASSSSTPSASVSSSLLLSPHSSLHGSTSGLAAGGSPRRAAAATISKEREEQQQRIIANCTPLRTQLMRVQEEAFAILRREIGHTAAGASGDAAAHAEARMCVVQDLERHHAERIHSANVAAAAIAV